MVFNRTNSAFAVLVVVGLMLVWSRVEFRTPGPILIAGSKSPFASSAPRWALAADSPFAAYLDDFQIPANPAPRTLENRICRHLGGHVHVSGFGAGSHADRVAVRCELKVAGHTTIAHVATLHQR